MATPTPTTTRTFTPADHGKRVDPDEFECGTFPPGHRYEIIDGRVYVSPLPNSPENWLERWLYKTIEAYSDANPAVINYVTTKGRVFLPEAVRATVPEPDIAAYTGYPGIDDVINWPSVSPILVAEVLVDASIEKDLGRNPRLYLRVPSIREYWVLNGAEDWRQPSLIRHVRKGKRWVVTTVPFGGTLLTPLLPGFSLVIDPRRPASPA